MRFGERSGVEGVKALLTGVPASRWWMGLGSRVRALASYMPAGWRWAMVPLGLALGVRVLLAVLVPVAVAHLFPSAYSDPLHIWMQKDAVWYVRIARDGYFYLPDSQSSAVFFPLFPLAMRLLYPLAAVVTADRDTGYFLAGVLVSWLAFAGACAALYRLVETRFDRRAAFAAVLLLSVYPFGWYFGLAFSEALFLLLVVLAFLGVERRTWWLAGLAAGLASAERPPGLVVGACVALAYGLDWLRSRRPVRRDVLALGLAPLGAAAYAGYCWLAFGTPTANLITSERGWQRGGLQLGGAQQAWQLLIRPGDWLGGHGMDIRAYGLYAILLVLVLASVVPIARLLGAPYALFTLVSTLSPLLAFSTVESLGRYISVVAPVFIYWGYLLRRRSWLLGAVAVACAVLLVIFATAFAAQGAAQAGLS